MNIAIICAGGNGERMRMKENKIFLKIGGKPLIYHTIKLFSEYDKVDWIIITIREEYKKRLKQIISKNKLTKVVGIEKAYETRQESTYWVIEKLKTLSIPDDSYIIIHNAVNPFVKHQELDRCLEAAETYGSSLLGFQATDTIKIIGENQLIDHTPNRSRVWVAQTPQIIRFDIAIKAFEYAFQKGFIATDDTTLVEAIHGKVKFVECSRENFKITYPQDLDLARSIYYKRTREKKPQCA